jgi:hypothetical protein
MKKRYQNPSTVMLKVETAILCASGVSPKQASGSLQSISKGNGAW